MSFKKILAVVVACVMAFGAFAASAFTLDVAEVAGETAEDVAVLAADALPEAVDGVITLTEDVVLTSTLTITSDVTIDLNGFKITSADISGEATRILKLIEVKNASLHIKDSIGGGKIVPGVCENLKSYNNEANTIYATDAVITIDDAVVEGQHGINTKYAGHAIQAYRSTINIINGAVVKGGDNDKYNIENENADVYYKNQGNSGKGIYAYGCDIFVTESSVSGGNGTVSGNTKTTGYVSGGANQSSGGVAIEARSDHVTSKRESILNATNSVFNGGTSATYEPEDALNIQGNTIAVIDGCQVIGGSVNPGMGNYGAGGNGVYLSGTPTVTIKNSTVVAGEGKSSTKNGALEVGSWSVAATVVVENTVLDGGKFYAIGGSGSDKLSSFTLKDTTVKGGDQLIEDNNITSITVEGTITVDKDSANKTLVGDNTAIYTKTGAEIKGTDTTVDPVVVVASVNGEMYGTIAEAVAAANDFDTVKIMPGTYKGGFSVGKNITLEGSVDADGNPTTILDGDNGSSSYYRYCLSMSQGTIKNIKIINAWKGIFTESKSGSLTIDNVTIVDAGYGIHIAGAKGANDTVTIKNSNIDVSWANSFAKGDYTLVIENNVLTSNNPYYDDGDGSPVVNTYVPNTTVNDNAFGENAKICVDSDAANDIVIGTNYYADGAENAVYAGSADVCINTYYTTPEMNETASAPIFVGENGYYSIQDALDAAEAEDEIEIQPGRYEEALSITKSVTLKGVAAKGTAVLADDAATKPVIVIKEVTNGGVQFHAPNVTFDNLVFEVAADATGSTWNVSAIGYYYENTANREGLTVTNCDFINLSNISMSAIAANIGNYTITNNTFKNFTRIIHSYVDHGAVDAIVVSDNEFENVDEIVNVYYGAPANDTTATITITNNKSTDGSTAKIVVDDFGMTKATPATAYNTVNITGNDAELRLLNYSPENFDLTNDSEMVLSYASEAVLRSMDGDLVDGVVYVAYGTNKQQMFIVVGGYVKTEASTVELVFVPNTEYDANALENSVWDLVLIASDAEIINRLNSGDFTFVLDSVNAMDYELIATNNEVVINNVEGDRYEFHYDGKTGTTTDTDLRIKLGTVKFTGYGAFTFGVKDVTTNAVHATTFVDNIVDTYLPDGDVEAGEGKLIYNNATEDTDGDTDFGTIDSEIVVPTADLTIKVAFPNSVNNNDLAYQKMNVLVAGNDIADVSIDLGTDNTGAVLTADSKKNCEYTVVFDEAACEYTIVIKNYLTLNTTYNVAVSGAGYRTARYTVTMTEEKTLNFWNNVKDNAVEVEEDKAASAVTKNFLAGDIVGDNQINIYDLSAVVSYFATDATTDYDRYVKYDLNRDGMIDSKDVAYVLVSWGE